MRRKQRRRRLWALLTPVRVRFVGMSVAGLLLIGLTASAERGAAVFGLAYVLGQQPAAAPSASPVIDAQPAPPATSAPSATPSPTPTPAAAPQPPAGPTAGAPASPSPVQVTVPITLPQLTPPPPSSPPSSSPSATPAPTPNPPSGGGAPPAPSVSPAPTPSTPPIALRVDTGATSYLSQISAVVPGDTWTRDATVVNTGGVGFKYVIALTQSANTALWSDPSGLTVRISSGATILYDGPAATMGTVAAPNTVAPGASDPLRFVFGLPVGADNSLQGLSQDLTLVFTATQFP